MYVYSVYKLLLNLKINLLYSLRVHTHTHTQTPHIIHKREGKLVVYRIRYLYNQYSVILS